MTMNAAGGLTSGYARFERPGPIQYACGRANPTYTVPVSICKLGEPPRRLERGADLMRVIHPSHVLICAFGGAVLGHQPAVAQTAAPPPAIGSTMPSGVDPQSGF